MPRTSRPASEAPALVERFWETVPPVWHQTRAHIRRLAAEQFQLTVEQFQVLRRIRRGHTSVSQLAEAGLTTRSSVSKAVDALVRRGLIERVPDPHDRRHIGLRLTGEGERLLTSLFDQTSRWLAEKFTTLTPAEAKRLQGALPLLGRAFQQPAPPAKKRGA